MDSEQEAQERAKLNLKKMAEAVVVNSIGHMRTVNFTLCAENKGKE